MTPLPHPTTDAGEHSAAAELVDYTLSYLRDVLTRSPIWTRMEQDTLPFAGRAAYLEQHWEGLRLLRDALASLPGAESDPALGPTLRHLSICADRLGETLDKAHATPRWREHHVTMPSLLQFRRRMASLLADANTVGILAHAIVRLGAVQACPVPGAHSALPELNLGLIDSEEREEIFAEELSAAVVLLMAQGAEVCRAHPVAEHPSCATTAAMIRSALRRHG